MPKGTALQEPIKPFIAMVLPISCNECRRRKIRCNRVHPCKNCIPRGISCTYPEKFRSIELRKLAHPPMALEEPRSEEEQLKWRIKELEDKLKTSEDLISIFDSSGSKDGHLDANGILSLELAMLDQSETSTLAHGGEEDMELPSLLSDWNENITLIKSLVTQFFDRMRPNYLRDLFDEATVIAWTDKISHRQPLQRDELMVLISIFIDRCKDINGEQLFEDQDNKVKLMVSGYFQISKSQSTESLNFINSQILMINYFYFGGQIEKAWKMLSQTVANSFANGLYIHQGTTWMKLTLFESVICCAASRPNLIYRMRKTSAVDVFREMELVYILRDWNMCHVDSRVVGKPPPEAEVWQLDYRLEQYTAVLRTIPMDERGLLLLLLSVDCHLRLKCQYLERFDAQVLRLIVENICLLEKAGSHVQSPQDYFAPLHCQIYQFVLLFLKYMNWKWLKELIGRGGVSEDMSVLMMCQHRLVQLLEAAQWHVSPELLKISKIIKSVDLTQPRRDHFVGGVEKFYASQEVKTLLENQHFEGALKDVTILMQL